MLLILSILVAVAAPRWSQALKTFRVQNAAARIAADLARAQAAAYNSSAPKTVTFAVATSQYVVGGVTPLNRSSGTYQVQLNDAPYYSALVAVWGQTGTQTITFNGYGLPDKGGSIVVVSGAMQKLVVVDALTGRASVQ